MGINLPAWQTTTKDINVTVGDPTQFLVDIPKDYAIDRILVMIVNADDNRSDGEVDEIILYDKVRAERWFDLAWKHFVRDVPKKFDVGPFTGFGVVELCEYQGLPELGDTTNLDLALGFKTIATGGKVKTFYQMVVPS